VANLVVKSVVPRNRKPTVVSVCGWPAVARVPAVIIAPDTIIVAKGPSIDLGNGVVQVVVNLKVLGHLVVCCSPVVGEQVERVHGVWNGRLANVYRMYFTLLDVANDRAVSELRVEGVFL
jgi:hypothetical protein